MFIHEQFSIGQVGIKLGDVGLGIGDVRGAAEVVAMIEEDVLNVGCVGRDIAITRLRIVRVFGLLPLDGRAGNISLVVELRSLHPTFGHRVVAQLPDDGIVAITRVVGIGRCTLHRRNTWRCAQLAVVLLALFLYLQHAGGIVFLACRNVVAADAVNITKLACSQFGGNALVADEVMLGKAVFRHGDNRGGIDGVVLRFVERKALRCTIYIYAFEVAVALDDALAGGIVGVSAGLTVVRQHHQAVVLVPIHAPLGVQAVVLHQRGITIGIVSVMLMPYLRGSRGVVAVLVLIREVVRLRRLCGAHLLHLGERFAHPPEGHRHLILRTLRLTVGPYQAVKVVVGISVVESTVEFCLAAIAIRGLRRVYSIDNTQDIVHSIVSVLVFHHSPSVRRKVHRLQTFTLLVVGVGCLRAVAQLGIDGMPVLVVTYPVNNNALTPLFIARKANYLPCRIVMIGNHLPAWGKL